MESHAVSFGLKNAGATYQRGMNAIFHDLIGDILEVYIDDYVIKSKAELKKIISLILEEHLRECVTTI